MTTLPKVQQAPFDVADWEEDAEFGVFPQGARAKEAVISPDSPPEPVIIPKRRYLFKRSRDRYPDQFWGEIVAYRVGCLLGVEVPPAFAAWNSRKGICASLIEWFYIDGQETFVMGGDFLMRLHPDYDRKKGKQHNLKDNTIYMRAFAQRKLLHLNWREWWVTALLFDALIGNTDRHQDNWGFVFSPREIRQSPLFDNGTALGHEILCDNNLNWDSSKIDKYILKGTHHMQWSLEDSNPIKGHMELLKHVLGEWPDTRQAASQCLGFDSTQLSESLKDLLEMDMPIKFSPERYDFILQLLYRRYDLLKTILS